MAEVDPGEDYRQELEWLGYPGEESVNCIGLWADLRLAGTGGRSRCWEVWRGAVRAEFGTVAWVERLRIWYFPRLASGRV